MTNYIPLFLLSIPLAGAVFILLCREKFIRHILTIFAALLLATVILGAYTKRGLYTIGSTQLGFDIYDPSFYVLGITSVLFFLVTFYLRSWLPADKESAALRNEPHGMSTKTFAVLLLIFVDTMVLTALSRDFGMLWVAVEATTLASAPLINFHKTKSSLEAMWKYLLLCSLGIGLALFGTMLLSASLAQNASLSFYSMAVQSPQWFKAAFVFCFAGYGLKCGLAPFHSWLPDAHSEAPSPVSALLSGSLLNCALLGMWRMRDVAPEGLLPFCNNFFIFFGIVSLVIAAFFIIGQKDYKRMLAYSSVEHMGLIALMIGFSSEGTALIHMIFHSLIKMLLFLTAGNLLLYYGTRKIASVQGLFTTLPKNARNWMIGMLFICGTPPSPLFFTEWVLVSRAGFVYGAIILLLLFIIFCAMCSIVMKMCMGGEIKNDFPQLSATTEKVTRVPSFILFSIILAFVASMASLYLLAIDNFFKF